MSATYRSHLPGYRVKYAPSECIEAEDDAYEVFKKGSRKAIGHVQLLTYGGGFSASVYVYDNQGEVEGVTFGDIRQSFEEALDDVVRIAQKPPAR